MSAFITVSSAQAATDTWAPEMRHNFQGTCLGRTGNDCALHTWAVTVIARDPGAGKNGMPHSRDISGIKST